MAGIRLIEARLPEFGIPDDCPELPREIYHRRYTALMAARERAGLDALVVYADREHSANMSYLTGFDPRFEEALMVIAPGEVPTLLAGPENLGRARASAIDVEARLYPPFGLLGQDRSLTPSLEEVFRTAGIRSDHRVGVIGWKYFTPPETSKPESWLETPAYLADTLRRIVGTEGRVVNAAGLLMDSTAGLRATNEIDRLVRFEFAAVHASEAIKRLFRNLRPGMTEYEAVGTMGLGVLPHACHTMLSTGDRLSGLESPSGRVIVEGDPLTTAVGYWGALSSRVGWVATGPEGMPPASRDYMMKLAMPYFAAAVDWYETIGIGVSGGTLDSRVRRHLDAPFFNLILNPGHLIHLDEWMNTPVYPGSTEQFRSTQAVQIDIIPAVGPPYYSCNIEDGIALLDSEGRAELRERFPAVAQRMETRRAFMGDVLGIRLKPEVMPFSNLAAALQPYILSPQLMLARR